MTGLVGAARSFTRVHFRDRVVADLVMVAIAVVVVCCARAALFAWRRRTFAGGQLCVVRASGCDVQSYSMCQRVVSLVALGEDQVFWSTSRIVWEHTQDGAAVWRDVELSFAVDSEQDGHLVGLKVGSSAPAAAGASEAWIRRCQANINLHRGCGLFVLGPERAAPALPTILWRPLVATDIPSDRPWRGAGLVYHGFLVGLPALVFVGALLGPAAGLIAGAAAPLALAWHLNAAGSRRWRGRLQAGAQVCEVTAEHCIAQECHVENQTVWLVDLGRGLVFWSQAQLIGDYCAEDDDEIYRAWWRDGRLQLLVDARGRVELMSLAVGAFGLVDVGLPADVVAYCCERIDVQQWEGLIQAGSEDRPAGAGLGQGATSAPPA